MSRSTRQSHYDSFRNGSATTQQTQRSSSPPQRQLLPSASSLSSSRRPNINNNSNPQVTASSSSSIRLPTLTRVANNIALMQTSVNQISASINSNTINNTQNNLTKSPGTRPLQKTNSFNSSAGDRLSYGMRSPSMRSPNVASLTLSNNNKNKSATELVAAAEVLNSLKQQLQEYNNLNNQRTTRLDELVVMTAAVQNQAAQLRRKQIQLDPVRHQVERLTLETKRLENELNNLNAVLEEPEVRLRALQKSQAATEEAYIDRFELRPHKLSDRVVVKTLGGLSKRDVKEYERSLRDEHAVHAKRVEFHESKKAQETTNQNQEQDQNENEFFDLLHRAGRKNNKKQQNESSQNNHQLIPRTASVFGGGGINFGASVMYRDHIGGGGAASSSINIFQLDTLEDEEDEKRRMQEQEDKANAVAKIRKREEFSPEKWLKKHVREVENTCPDNASDLTEMSVGDDRPNPNRKSKTRFVRERLREEILKEKRF